MPLRCATVFILFAALPALPQSTQAELRGMVLDPAALPVPDAELALMHQLTAFRARTVSNAQGNYYFLALPPGPYSIEVLRKGFRPLVRGPLHLAAGSTLTFDAQLQIEPRSEALVIADDSPLLNTTQSSVSFELSPKQVTALPLNGRNFIPLLALSPGVALPPNSLLPRINGSRPRTSEYLYDGVSVLQPEPGQPVFYPILDAVAELRLDANAYSAEYGHSNGGVIHVNHKAGGNDLHGTLFYFLRHQSLNARNHFAAAEGKPAFRRSQPGFVFGGPLRHNRIFFFSEYQATLAVSGIPRISTVPTLDQRAGRFQGVAIFDPLSGRRPFPGSVIPPSRFDSIARAAMNLYPTPSSPTAANNFFLQPEERTGQHQGALRMDHYLSAISRLTARAAFSRDDATAAAPLPDGSGLLASGILAPSLTGGLALTAEYNRTPSPNLALQLRAGYTRRSIHRNSQTAALPSPPVPPSAFPAASPTYDIAGYQSLGPSPNANSRFATSVAQLLPAATLLTARHHLRAGADYRRQSLDILQPPNPAGLFQFTPILTGHSVASFLTGAVQSFSFDSQPKTLQPRAHTAEFFLQDDIRLSPRLTANAGVRYTLNFPSTERQGRAAVFNLDSQQLDFPHTARNLERANFGPRVGLAFQSAPTTVIRAAYGLVWIEQAGITTPFTTPLFPFVQTVQQFSLDNLTPAFALGQGPSLRLGAPNADSGLGQGVFATQRTQKSGYAQQWNFSVQTTLREVWSIEAGYLGSKLTNLGVPDVNLNQLPAELLALGSQLLARQANTFSLPPNSSLATPTLPRHQFLREYPRFTTVALYRNNVGHSTYHSLQTRLSRRAAESLTLTAAYTFSKLLDDAGAVFDAALLTGPPAVFQVADSHNRKLEKDVSTGHIPHIFSASATWQPRNLPRLQLAALARAQSGSPLPVTQLVNFNAFAGFGIQRPNRTAQGFAEAGQFTLGNASRNPLTGPAFRAVDLMAAWTVPLTESGPAFEFRGEIFNFANSVNFAAPNTQFGAPAFLTYTAAHDPSLVQISLRLRF